MAAETGLRGAFWPTEVQRELLRAGLLEPAEAISSWQKVKSVADIDGLDPESLRLLPLIYVNLVRSGARDPEMGRLKGLYRKTWFQNELASRRWAEALASLSAAGIPTTVLKGAALADLYYRDRGARPMHDMDIHVPSERWVDAREVLRGLDWHAPSLRFRGIPRFRSALEFKHRDGSRVDLHWHVMEYFSRPQGEPADAAGSLQVVAAEVAGVPTHVLDDPDQLVHVCLHGARSFPTGNVVWVADAMKILDRVPTLDWERFFRLAASYGCTRALGEALQYLSDRFGAPIPRGVLTAFRSSPISAREALGFWLTSRPDRGSGTMHRTARGIGRYLRLTSAWKVGEAMRHLPQYLQEIENLERPGQIPLATLRRMLHPAPPPQVRS